MYKELMITLSFTTMLFADHYYLDGKKETLTKIPLQTQFKNRSVHEEVDYYKDRAGNKVGVNNTLIVAFNDMQIQKEIEKRFSLSLLQKLINTSFLYKVKDKNQTLDIANALTHTKGIAYAYPNFIQKKQRRTNDPLFGATWHLNDPSAGIHAPQAWKYTKGAGIRVGVYDEGIDLEHEDLVDNIIGYGNYANNDAQIDMRSHQKNNLHNAPEPASNSEIWHGTSCAGLIAASGDNGKGSVGVAPEAKLVTLRYADSTALDIKAFHDMADIARVDIISNSWGTYQLKKDLELVFKKLAKEGRKGRGALLFFAAGNDGCDMDKYYLKDDSGFYHCSSSSKDAPIDDESESPYVLSIAASTKSQRIAGYSNFGSNIDFTAPGSDSPSSIVTTDASGDKGSKVGNYTRSFSGTSAAAPIAAGIAALVLAENPKLSREEVLDIFKQTAKKIGHYPYDENGRNNHWGYGELDAGAAVALANHYGSSKIENFFHKIYKNMH